MVLGGGLLMGGRGNLCDFVMGIVAYFGTEGQENGEFGVLVGLVGGGRWNNRKAVV